MPKISSPYQQSFESVFTITSIGLNYEKLSCRICERNIESAFMISHIAKYSLRENTLRPFCDFCELVHTRNLRKISKKKQKL